MLGNFKATRGRNKLLWKGSKIVRGRGKGRERGSEANHAGISYVYFAGGPECKLCYRKITNPYLLYFENVSEIISAESTLFYFLLCIFHEGCIVAKSWRVFCIATPFPNKLMLTTIIRTAFLSTTIEWKFIPTPNKNQPLTKKKKNPSGKEILQTFNKLKLKLDRSILHLPIISCYATDIIKSAKVN